MDNITFDYSLDKDRTEDLQDKIVETYRKIVEVCEKRGFPSPLIAGGCIRDALLGIPGNDIDVFIDCSQQTDEELCVEDQFLLLADDFYGSLGRAYQERPEDPKYGSREGHFLLYDDLSPTSLPIQLIGHKDPRIQEGLSFTDDFHSTSVQCIYNGEFRFKKEMLEDISNKLFRILPGKSDEVHQRNENKIRIKLDELSYGWKYRAFHNSFKEWKVEGERESIPPTETTGYRLTPVTPLAWAELPFASALFDPEALFPPRQVRILNGLPPEGEE